MEKLTIFDLISEEARRNPEEMTLAEIEKHLSCSRQVSPLLLKKLYADPRKGAAQLAKRWSSKNERVATSRRDAVL